MASREQTCETCGSHLLPLGGLKLCPRCDDVAGLCLSLGGTVNDFTAETDRVLIECPGATIYRSGTNDIIAGARFKNDSDPTCGFIIIDKPVYGPHHVRYRWVRNKDLHLIRRCQSCQDHTVRMRRREGPDLYIPSRKNLSGRPHHKRR